MKRQTLTFSQKVKNEILQNEKSAEPCCNSAYLAALIRGAGSLAINNSGLGFELATSSLETLKFANQLLKRMNRGERDIVVSSKSKSLYTMECFDTGLMFELGIVCRDGEGLVQIGGIEKYLEAAPYCKKSFVKGMFLSCGSITVPEPKNGQNTGFHMEFQLTDEKIAEEFAKLLYGEGFSFKVTHRGSKSAVYLKDKDVISDMVVYLGASASRLELENVLILRDIRNTANRQSNCTTANIDRSLDAAEKQVEAITKLIERGKLNLLDERLKKTADLRMENIDEPLDSLAKKLGISKSGVNHRMRKLIELAEEPEDE